MLYTKSNKLLGVQYTVHGWYASIDANMVIVCLGQSHHSMYTMSLNEKCIFWCYLSGTCFVFLFQCESTDMCSKWVSCLQQQKMVNAYIMLKGLSTVLSTLSLLLYSPNNINQDVYVLMF